MAKTTKLFAAPISRVRSLRTGAVVGWVYRWDTGEVQTTWLQKEDSPVTFESLDDEASTRPEIGRMQPLRDPEPKPA